MSEKDKSEGDKIWDEIQNLRINMYALANQRVKQHVKRIGAAVPDSLFLKLNSSAVIVGLEEILDPDKYTIEQAEGYVIVKRTDPGPDLKELLPQSAKKGIINRIE